jgi:hypothetical protein
VERGRYRIQCCPCRSRTPTRRMGVRLLSAIGKRRDAPARNVAVRAPLEEADARGRAQGNELLAERLRSQWRTPLRVLLMVMRVRSASGRRVAAVGRSASTRGIAQQLAQPAEQSAEARVGEQHLAKRLLARRRADMPRVARGRAGEVVRSSRLHEALHV